MSNEISTENVQLSFDLPCQDLSVGDLTDLAGFVQVYAYLFPLHGGSTAGLGTFQRSLPRH